ncbi:formyltetrahydrofolate deformylase [Rhodococcus wratislaviensis]|uniref:formyltetrahydrofolate deformylase n=1 Tax=Rhodococcus wratislaviensis TaxID=44752 RepID=UPI003658D18A
MTITEDRPTRIETPRAGDEGCLIVSGNDSPGIVVALSAVLSELGANIVSFDQHSTDLIGGRFFLRTMFRLQDLALARPLLQTALDREIRDKLGLEWRLTESSKPKRVALFTSKTDHCLLDLLWRHSRGELNISVEMVVSNHPDLAEKVRAFGIPYFFVPVENGDKKAAEQEHLRLLNGNVDFVVLARYMQIISGEFIRDVGVPIINIHHSFLPAFIGAGPYKKARDRGVKLIGATAHYVTEDLDEGPIIEQDVVRVSHSDSTQNFVRRGADVERQVLSRAVAWHSEDRVVRDGNTTIVFAS